MIVSTPIYGAQVNLRVAVYNPLTSAWVEILGTSTTLNATRGGAVGIAGIASVEVGTFSINILDALDPSQVTLLFPNQRIVAYVDDDSAFTTPLTDGAIFTGNIQDISTNYFFVNGTQHVNVVIYATDAVSSHTGITVTNLTGQEGFTGTTLNGVANTANGFQRWEDRINDLTDTFQPTVPNVTISSPEPIYSI